MFGLVAAWHELLHWAGVIVCVAGAVAAIIYIPGRLGAAIATICIGIASGLVAYDEGFRARGALDQSADLREQIAQQQAVIAERQKEAEAAKVIADEAGKRVAEAEKKSADLQGQVDDYARTLSNQPQPTVQQVCDMPPAQRPKIIGCGLSNADVRGLQSIGGPASAPQPPARPWSVRSARPRPRS